MFYKLVNKFSLSEDSISVAFEFILQNNLQKQLDLIYKTSLFLIS